MLHSWLLGKNQFELAAVAVTADVDLHLDVVLGEVIAEEDIEVEGAIGEEVAVVVHLQGDDLHFVLADVPVPVLEVRAVAHENDQSLVPEKDQSLESAQNPEINPNRKAKALLRANRNQSQSLNQSRSLVLAHDLSRAPRVARNLAVEVARRGDQFV